MFQFSNTSSGYNSNDSENSKNVNDLNEQMENNRKVMEAVEELFKEINEFQNIVFSQPEMDYLLRNMQVNDALAVACYFKLGFMTNAKNEKLAIELVKKIKKLNLVIINLK
jgi:hypothetical protein